MVKTISDFLGAYIKSSLQNGYFSFRFLKLYPMETACYMSPHVGKVMEKSFLIGFISCFQIQFCSFYKFGSAEGAARLNE